MKKLSKLYRIIIKCNSVKHVLSDGWETYIKCYNFWKRITDRDGDFVDENGLCWNCYIEEYYGGK